MNLSIAKQLKHSNPSPAGGYFAVVVVVIDVEVWLVCVDVRVVRVELVVEVASGLPKLATATRIQLVGCTLRRVKASKLLCLAL